MTKHDKNITRALAAVTVGLDVGHISVKEGIVNVGGLDLYLGNEDDESVLSMLTATAEFNEAIDRVEEIVEDLRDMRKFWLDAAEDLKSEYTEDYVSQSERNLRAIDADMVIADAILRRHVESEAVEGYEIDDDGGLTCRFAM